ncbi:hypothetical protein EYF80_007627 [Liparis tanakae]|uniref:Uncharacterized protein n=1 Tax=Liparis tanakae TaxID=230148 RepID=A0A4Z2IVX4_9TELE|nr:hypothetical protein EYF80_007627 [Liparis tanakae]
MVPTVCRSPSGRKWECFKHWNFQRNPFILLQQDLTVSPTQSWFSHASLPPKGPSHTAPAPSSVAWAPGGNRRSSKVKRCRLLQEMLMPCRVLLSSDLVL